MRASRWLVALLLLAGAATPLMAQSGGMGGGMGGGRHGGGRRGGGGYSTHSAATDLIADPVIWDGPPALAELPQTIKLTEEQRDHYNTVYDTFMVATKRVRDQARANRAALNGGPSPLQGGSDTPGGGVAPTSSVIDDLKQEGEYLSDKQKIFDKTLKTFFSKPQMKEYTKWRKAQRKEAERQQQQSLQGGGNWRGRGRPPS